MSKPLTFLLLHMINMKWLNLFYNFTNLFHFNIHIFLQKKIMKRNLGNVPLVFDVKHRQAIGV